MFELLKPPSLNEVFVFLHRFPSLKLSAGLAHQCRMPLGWISVVDFWGERGKKILGHVGFSSPIDTLAERPDVCSDFRQRC